jgi:hypothetical protein
MLELPSRDALRALTQAINAVTPAVMVCLTRPFDGPRVQVLYTYELGFGSYVVPINEIPAALHPAEKEIGHCLVIRPLSGEPLLWVPVSF